MHFSEQIPNLILQRDGWERVFSSLYRMSLDLLCMIPISIRNPKNKIAEFP